MAGMIDWLALAALLWLDYRALMWVFEKRPMEPQRPHLRSPFDRPRKGA